jgi:hypothetical protein
VEFISTLFRWTSDGAWVFTTVPEEHAPGRPGPFGRVPVIATVDGRSWATSVWRDRKRGWILLVPARIRRDKDEGDEVTIEIEVDTSRL